MPSLDDTQLGIHVTTTADLAGLNEAESAVTGLRGGLANLGTSLQQMGDKMAAVAPLSIAAGAALAAMSLYVKGAVENAGALEKSIAKINVVFGDSATAIKNWSQDTATSMGISQIQALQTAGMFGNLLTAMGLTTNKAAEMSTGVIQLAADLASFNNIPIEEATNAIRSGLVGMERPLKALGIVITATMLKQEALKLGLIASTKEALTPAITAQASYALILQQTTKAQGDFARNSGDLENAQKILNATLTNLSTELGTAFLPIITKILNTLAPLIDKLTVWITKHQELTKWIIILTAGFLAFVAVIAPLGLLIAGIGAAIAALATPIGAIVAIIAVLGTAIAALTVIFITNFQKIKAGFIDPLLSGLHAIDDAITSVLQKLGLIGKGKTFSGQVSEGFKSLLDIDKSILGFAKGGTVPGPIGAPMLAVVHGGEQVIPVNGGTTNSQNVNLTINVSEKVDLQMVAQMLDKYLGNKAITRAFGVS